MVKEIKNYDKAIVDIIDVFCKKQDVEFSYSVGGLFCFIEQYFFSIHDIIFDLKSKQKKGTILEWDNYLVNTNIGSSKHPYTISYEAYCKGYRYEA